MERDVIGSLSHRINKGLVSSEHGDNDSFSGVDGDTAICADIVSLKSDHGSEFGVLTLNLEGPIVDRTRVIGKACIVLGDPNSLEDVSSSASRKSVIVWLFENHQKSA